METLATQANVRALKQSALRLGSNRFFVFVFLINTATSISFRWCATKVEMDKCRQFIQYVNETAQNKSLPLKVLKCVEGSSYDDCATKIKEDKADLVTLDGGRVYAAGTNIKVKKISSFLLCSFHKILCLLNTELNKNFSFMRFFVL